MDTTFKIHIEVSLSKETLSVLKQLVPSCTCRCHEEEDMPEEIYNGPDTAPQKPAEEPAPEMERQAVREPKAAQAPKETPAPAPKADISDSFLREKVKAAKDRTSAKAVREVFSQFRIASSVECPEERRGDLVAALENLK